MAAKRSGAPPPPISPALRNALATNLRAARLAAGLTQKALGDLASVSRDYIGQIEAATANVSIDILTVLATHVDKSPLDLLSAPSKRPPRRN
jgi:XRE family transcriptional regulator, regulator of sulfur utilization